MDFSLLTYNTLLNDAQIGLRKIFANQHPDIVCLQEIDTTKETFEAIEELGYRLADYSNAFIKFGRIYGVATFYRPERFTFVQSKSISLPRGYLEAISFILRIFRTKKKNRTILKTEFVCNKTKQHISVYNIHLSAHGTNGIRIKQIRTALEDMVSFNVQNPTILTGDFNYPYGRKKLEKVMHGYGLEEATNTIFFTSEGAMKHYAFLEKIVAGIFFNIMRHRLKLDYIFYKNCRSLFAKKIDVEYSDHYPVFAVFKLPK